MFEENRLLCVAPHLVPEVWPHVEHLIERALNKSASDMSLADVRQRIDDGDALLWIIWCQTYRNRPIQGHIAAAGTTEINALHDGRRVLTITNLAGRDMKRWEQLLDDIFVYAKTEGCELVRCYGRRGWLQYLRPKGWSEPWVCLEKKVDGPKQHHNPAKSEPG